MKNYRIGVTQDDGWFVGQVLERQGITTQGKTLDHLVFMVRDAISLMWNENGVQLELILPAPWSLLIQNQYPSVISIGCDQFNRR